MTTGVVIGLLVISALISLNLLWDWRRSGRLFCTPLPRRYRGRSSQEAVWSARYGGDRLANVDAVLRSVCEGFSFNPDDRYKFGPDDQIMEIYRALYPRWKFWQLGDSLEIETLMIDLNKWSGIEAEVWRPEVSLGELVGLAGTSTPPASP
jgi:propanediol dehydratase small subunit